MHADFIFFCCCMQMLRAMLASGKELCLLQPSQDHKTANDLGARSDDPHATSQVDPLTRVQISSVLRI